MKMRGAVLGVAFILCLISCGKKDATGPLKKAVISLTVDSTPILMTWDYYVKLWYMKCFVTARETGGVGVNISRGTKWFIYQNRRYEEESIEGLRLNAFGMETLYIESGTKYEYDQVEFEVVGRDDNGNSIQVNKKYDLHYVGLD